MKHHHTPRTLCMISILFVLLCSIIFKNDITATVETTPRTDSEYTILYINSYSEGYKWSDDIYNGIKYTFFNSPSSISLKLEHLDMQHINDDAYYTKLYELFRSKYSSYTFDMVITSDDSAYRFMEIYGDELFPEVPKVFCGLNYYDSSLDENSTFKAGLVEKPEFNETIELMKKLHPSLKKIYYVNDTSPTGLSIQKALDSVFETYDAMEFIPFDYGAYFESKTIPGGLDAQSAILFALYTLDGKGNPYTYDQVLNELSKSFNIPIYGLADFSLGEGIVGGKLISGFHNGEALAEMALDILEGNAPVNPQDKTAFISGKYMFDYDQLSRFDLKPNLLPGDSLIINDRKSSSKSILILNSYNRGLQWTDDIEQGISDILDESLYNINYTYEYMDLKTHTDPLYAHELNDFLVSKYSQMHFDLIVTSDNGAYNFMKKHQALLFPDTPVIFCGVNHMVPDILEKLPNSTGIIETTDISDTIELATTMFPDATQMIVINDRTITGKCNRKNLELSLDEVDPDLDIIYWEDMNMSEIQQQGKTLGEESIVLLMSYTKDKSNNTYSYKTSLKLIRQDMSAPIFGVWDFYLGNGIIGGKLTSGYEQGKSVGIMVLNFLGGTPISAMPIQANLPNKYMFDYEELERFGIDSASLPQGSAIINRPKSKLELFYDNREFILLTLVILITITAGIISFIFFRLGHRLISEFQPRAKK